MLRFMYSSKPLPHGRESPYIMPEIGLLDMLLKISQLVQLLIREPYPVKVEFGYVVVGSSFVVKIAFGWHSMMSPC